MQPVGDNRKARPTIADDSAATPYRFGSADFAARIARVIGEEDSPGGATHSQERTIFP